MIAPLRPTSLLLHALRSGRKAISNVEQEQYPTAPLVPPSPSGPAPGRGASPLAGSGSQSGDIPNVDTARRWGDYLPPHRKHVMSLSPSVILRPVRTAVATLGLGQAPLWVWTRPGKGQWISPLIRQLPHRSGVYQSSIRDA